MEVLPAETDILPELPENADTGEAEQHSTPAESHKSIKETHLPPINAASPSKKVASEGGKIKSHRSRSPSPTASDRGRKNWVTYTNKNGDGIERQASDGNIKTKAGRLVSSPTREEREKRKKWAEEAQRRRQLALERTMASESATKAEYEARLEERRRKVRERIEQEKEALAKMAAKRAAVSGGGYKPEESDMSNSGGGLGGDNSTFNAASERSGGGSVPRRRSPSPRPLYQRMQEDYERKQQAEEEEARRRMDAQIGLRQVRVQALMNGEVIIKPLDDEIRQPKEQPRWNPSGRFRGTTTELRSNASPRRSPGGSVNGDHSGPSSPTTRKAIQQEQNGMVLYSMQDGEDGHGRAVDGASSGGGAAGLGRTGDATRRGKLVTRREPQNTGAGSQRFNGMHRRMMNMVDRACSPITIDPATGTPTNCPSQDQFWPPKIPADNAAADGNAGADAGGAARPGPKAKGSPSKRLGALEQAPPPPPVSHFNKQAKDAGKGVAGKVAKAHGSVRASIDIDVNASIALESEKSQLNVEDSSVALPTDQQLEAVLGPEDSTAPADNADTAAAAGAAGDEEPAAEEADQPAAADPEPETESTEAAGAVDDTAAEGATDEAPADAPADTPEEVVADDAGPAAEEALAEPEQAEVAAEEQEAVPQGGDEEAAQAADEAPAEEDAADPEEAAAEPEEGAEE